MIVQLVMTDGRDDLLDATLKSAQTHLLGPITRRVIFDDTGDINHAAELSRRYDDSKVVTNGRRNGFGDAVRLAWAFVEKSTTEPYVLHLEDDFTFDRDVDLWAMAEVLDRHRYLAQMALRRQPWNEQERLMGGVVECNPLEYVERWSEEPQAEWLEHRLFWSTNPSLFRRDLLNAGWMGGEQSEGRFTHLLLSEGHDGASWADVRFGYWGARDSGVWVTHTGAQRVGTGY